MLNDMAWNVFKKTGDINTFLECKGIEKQNQYMNQYSTNFVKTYNIDNEVIDIGDLFGNNKN